MVRLYNNLIFFLFIIIANKCTLLHLFVLTLDILILYNYNEGEVMKEYVLLVPNSIKKEIIKIVREKYYNYNVKFMSLEEFNKKYTFDYDNKTIYKIMKEYDINYDTALIYLNNLYYISDKLDNGKMSKLREIKEYLDSNNLLIYNKYFKEYVKDKEIVIYGYDYVNKYYLGILDDLNYRVIYRENKENVIDKIYKANYIEDEVIFVANKIARLLKDNVSIDNIKIIAGNEYIEIIRRIFKLYNIPVNIASGSVYSTYECKRVLDNLNDIEILDSIKDIDIRNKIVKVLNNYSFINDKEEVKELIIKDLKNTSLDSSNSGIDIISLNDYIEEDIYVFLMGYNKENIPRVCKDNEYFSDKEKIILELDTSNDINIKERDSVIKRILGINNLTISYKLYDSSNNYTKSDLFEDIEEVKIVNSDYSNSNIINRIFLTKKLDSLVKYNVKEEDIDILYSNYSIPYMEYDNSYNGISKDKLYRYLDDKLTLAYTSFDNYNRCKFKYYLANILKINIIRDDFAIIIGNICHYILSSIDNEDFDTYKYFDKFVSEQREFSNRELFFLSSIREEMVFVVDTIRKQLSYSTFDKSMYEKKVYVNKDKNIKVTFMGVIDKVLYKEEDGITYLAVVDYKTGSTDIKLDNKEYGIGMQLPIYLYLSSKMELENVKVVGFYLQKLFSGSLDNTKDYDTARENALKLEGYSVDNESLLSKFDTTYNDSKLIKSMKTSSNGFYSYSKVLSEEDIDNLITETDDMVDKTIDNILEADFAIDPKVINGENVSCKFCDYKDICFRREKDLNYINRESA